MSNQMFERILNDTTNGSTDIFIKFLEFIRKYPPSMDELLVYIDDLKKQYYEMLVIRNGADKLWNHYRKFKNVQESARILQNEITSYNFQILKNLRNYVDRFHNKVCLTISNSLTLQFALQDLDFKEIYIMRSEPGGEGLYLFDKIENSLLVEDERAVSLIRSGVVDIILMGCDAFIPENMFINKVGSAKICNAATEIGIPVYILTNSLKETEKLPEIKSQLFEEIPITPNIKIVTEIL
jgi:translation initiation factor 2B subunit (eIF-2B alpha/beta/delta family)